MVCSQALTNALEKVAVIVEALLTVALVARQRVLTATLLADFISKQRTLVDICRQGRKNLSSVTDSQLMSLQGVFMGSDVQRNENRQLAWTRISAKVFHSGATIIVFILHSLY